MSKNIALLLLSFLIISGYLYDVYLVLGGHIDTTDPNKLLMIGQAVGGLQGMAMMVAGYWFGTTKGSEDKNTAVSEAIAKLPTAPSTQVTTTTVAPTPTSTVTTASTTIQQETGATPTGNPVAPDAKS